MHEDVALEPLYKSKTGWAIVGKNWFFSANARSPLGKITIWQDKVEISARLKAITLSKTEVSNIITYKLLASKGIQFIHNRGDLSPYVIFGSNDINTVIGILRQAGYPVNV